MGGQNQGFCFIHVMYETAIKHPKKYKYELLNILVWNSQECLGYKYNFGDISIYIVFEAIILGDMQSVIVDKKEKKLDTSQNEKLIEKSKV